MASVQEDNPAASPTDPPPVTSHTPVQDNPDILLAEQGDAFAQYRLGRFYAQQNGSHSPESVNWYMKASDGLRRLASAGNGKAMYVLGVMYAFGRGVVQNKEEARSWLTQAVAHQVPAAGPVLAVGNGRHLAIQVECPGVIAAIDRRQVPALVVAQAARRLRPGRS